MEDFCIYQEERHLGIENVVHINNINNLFKIYIEHKTYDLINLAKEFQNLIEPTRELLKNEIHQLDKGDYFKEIIVIDSSNSKNIAYKLFSVIFSVNAISYFQSKNNMVNGTYYTINKIYEIPLSDFNNTLINLYRDLLELKLFLNVSNKEKSEIIFLDGPINSLAL